MFCKLQKLILITCPSKFYVLQKLLFNNLRIDSSKREFRLMFASTQTLKLENALSYKNNKNSTIMNELSFIF